MDKTTLWWWNWQLKCDGPDRPKRAPGALSNIGAWELRIYYCNKKVTTFEILLKFECFCHFYQFFLFEILRTFNFRNFLVFDLPQNYYLLKSFLFLSKHLQYLTPFFRKVRTHCKAEECKNMRAFDFFQLFSKNI